MSVSVHYVFACVYMFELRITWQSRGAVIIFIGSQSVGFCLPFIFMILFEWKWAKRAHNHTSISLGGKIKMSINRE